MREGTTTVTSGPQRYSSNPRMSRANESDQGGLDSRSLDGMQGSGGPTPRFYASSAQISPLLSQALIRSRSVSARLACLDRGHELAAEIRDVRHHPTPHQVAVAEGGLVHPGRACVHQVVLDPKAAGGPLAVHDP